MSVGEMKTVLVIDDDRDFRELIAVFLRQGSYNVRQAESIADARQIIDGGEVFSAALVDFWFGRENAVDLLDMIRDRFPTIPVVMMSGGGNDVPLETIQAVGEISGALLFLQKPFKKNELIELLDTVT